MATKSTTQETTYQQPKTHSKVIIVGAGPVGLLIALALGRAGIDVLVIEAHHELLRTTRAIVYMPIVIPALKSLGLLDVVLEHAFLNHEGIRWRDVSGQQLAHLPVGNPSNNIDDAHFSGIFIMGQYRMACLVLEELSKYPSVQVSFGLRCVGIENIATSTDVKVMVHAPYKPGSINNDNDILLTTQYVIGTDGANSAVRRLCCIPFDGFTYPDFRMIGTDVLYDFMEHEQYSPLNFVVHPKDWAVIAYTGEDEDGNSFKASTGRPLWRIAYVEDPNLSSIPEEITKRAYERTSRYMKKYRQVSDTIGNDDVNKYDFEIARAEPYLMSQRVAQTPYKGRVYLAGDALHSNNPIGGLGLTGGILDAFCYGNAFTRVLQSRDNSQQSQNPLDDTLLQECATSRWNAWRNVTNDLSFNNMERLYSQDPAEVKKRDAFFAKLNDGELARKEVASAVGNSLRKMMSEDFSGNVS